MARQKLKVRSHPSEPEESVNRAGDFDLDLFAQGPLSDMLERFRFRLLEEAAKIAANRKIDAVDLERAYERLLCPSGSEDWQVLNRRRVYLIQKQVTGGILPEELVELAGLQGKADRRMSEVAPRPLEMLWDLKRKLTGQ